MCAELYLNCGHPLLKLGKKKKKKAVVNDLLLRKLPSFSALPGIREIWLRISAYRFFPLDGLLPPRVAYQRARERSNTLPVAHFLKHSNIPP
jgi:hypothetical protein